MILPRHRGLEQWTAEVVHPGGDREPLPLDADAPPTFNWRKGQASPLGGRLECLGRIPELRHGQHIIVTYSCDTAAPVSLPPLVPTMPDATHDMSDSFGLDVIDQTILLAADGLDFARVLPPGLRATTAMRDLATQSAPDLDIRLPDIDLTLRVSRDLPLSSAPLEGINKLAETIGATPLAPQLDGSLASHVWTPARERAIAGQFGPGADMGWLPTVRARSDYLAAPNVVHYRGRGAGSSDEIIGRWLDLDPNSPWSIPSRRRRILATGSGDAANQTVADQHARRIGLEARGRGRTATITAPWQPIIPGDIVTTLDPDRPHVSARWEVEAVAWSGGTGSLATYTLQEVI